MARLVRCRRQERGGLSTGDVAGLIARLESSDGFAATGLPTLADDSGIAVAALNGMPGVLSARWSGGLVDPDVTWHIFGE